ncbi:MAG: peptidylprolyl isomerase [Methanoregula sp.]|nr:peptidylprolyl isomerase [Methanoregula sp.]
MYKVGGIIVLEIIMKKSEKVKGREAVAAKKRLYPKLAMVAAAGILILVIIGYILLNPSGAKTGDMVTVEYTGTLTDGTVFDSNVNATPLTFIIGQGKVIFEESVKGISQGEIKTVNLPADKAYGPYNEALVHVINRSAFPDDLIPEVGGVYAITRQPDGAIARVKIINVTPTTVTWDENHELAGKDLVFTIRIIEIQKG